MGSRFFIFNKKRTLPLTPPKGKNRTLPRPLPIGRGVITLGHRGSPPLKGRG